MLTKIFNQMLPSSTMTTLIKKRTFILQNLFNRNHSGSRSTFEFPSRVNLSGPSLYCLKSEIVVRTIMFDDKNSPNFVALNLNMMLCKPTYIKIISRGLNHACMMSQ